MSKGDSEFHFWRALFHVGWILIIVTTLPGVALVLYAAVTQGNLGVDGGAYAIGSLIMSGLAIMIYASANMTRRNRSDQPAKLNI